MNPPLAGVLLVAALSASGAALAAEIHSEVHARYLVQSDIAIVRGSVSSEEKDLAASARALQDKIARFRGLAREVGLPDSLVLVRTVSTDGVRGFFSGKTSSLRQGATLEIWAWGAPRVAAVAEAIRRFGPDFELREIRFDNSRKDSLKAALDSILLRKALDRQADLSRAFGKPCRITSFQGGDTWQPVGGYLDNPQAVYLLQGQTSGAPSDGFVLPQEYREATGSFVCSTEP